MGYFEQKCARWVMAVKSLINVRTVAKAALVLALLYVPAASAADCPGHPDAIGTSRTIVVDPREHPRIGSMQYPETLPLRDHEVVLTFDDGPLPRNSNQVLQILADNCAKATFFLIGQQARANPEGVRKLLAAGHTIGTHSQNHPLTFKKMPLPKVQQEVDDGIASVTAALPDPSAVAPFFRVPGLLRSQTVDDYLASKNIQVWSADFLADDWRHISSAKVYDLAIKRLEEAHKGILLLHDIQARTVAALPKILHEMKVRGYHIVQVVPATPERPATPTEPQDWRMHPVSQTLPVAETPKFPSFVYAEAERLVTPTLSDFNSPDGRLLLSAEPFDHVKRPMQSGSGTASATASSTSSSTSWPTPAPQSAQNAAATLPAPDESVFAMPEKAQAALPQASATGAAAPSPHAVARVKPVHGRNAHAQVQRKPQAARRQARQEARG